GYTVYCDLVKPYFPNKEYISTPMMREIERCRMALQRAAEGKLTAMICSGDAGIYGMASPILELADEYGVEVEIIAGVTAASSGAALLGSPLTCDFTVISLSDLLTPMDVIEKRIEGAAMSDICVVLYNPSSKKRADHLKKCCDLLLKYRVAETVCGIVQQIGREGESTRLLTLGELADYPADMFTTIFIGNSTTKIRNGKMVTPRGYQHD
ncbi:MAG: precorrin-3B C(17)-methyltransferase, partial [Eubacteriales bacterium]